MSEWLPIETAPKDGTRILVWAYWDNCPTIVWWGDLNLRRSGKDRNEYGWRHENAELLGVERWMPPPAPPEPPTDT